MNLRNLIVATILTFALALTLSVTKSEGDTASWKGLRTLDQIEPKEMILPLVVIDVPEGATKNPDYRLSTERLKKMGNGSWRNSCGHIRCDAHRLVKALA
jgi:hypothetical protein